MSKDKSFEIFASLVSSFRLSEPGDQTDYEKIKVSNLTWLDSSTGVQEVPSVWFQPYQKLTLKALQIKLHKWLLRLGVAVDEDTVGILTCVLAILSEDGHSLSESIQLLEDHVFEIDVLHCHALPTLAGEGWKGALEWDGFKFGRLDAQKLVYRCRKAQAINHEKIAGSLDGAPALWSPVFKRRIVDVGRLFWKLRSNSVRKHGPSVLEPLLQRTALLHVEAMWEALEDAFLLPVALSVPIFEISSLRLATGGETWTCFSGIGLNGTQTWINRTIHIQTERMPSDWNQVQRLLDGVRDRYHLDDLGDSKLNGLLNQVARSVSRSNSHLSAARRDESFLFLIVALEQVFSEKENTTKAVSGRTALITHRMLEISYSEAVKRVANLYDRRSRLVHRGEVGVSVEDLLATSDLAAGKLQCLVRHCAMKESTAEHFHKKWLKKLDYLIAGFDAGSPPTDEILIETGILESQTP